MEAVCCAQLDEDLAKMSLGEVTVQEYPAEVLRGELDDTAELRKSCECVLSYCLQKVELACFPRWRTLSRSFVAA